MSEMIATAARRSDLALDDGSLSVLRWGRGEGPPDLIFLHATGFNALTYDPLLAPLAETAAVAAIDQRGHGLSTLPADPSGLIDWWPYARDLVAVLDRWVPEGAPPVVSQAIRWAAWCRCSPPPSGRRR